MFFARSLALKYLTLSLFVILSLSLITGRFTLALSSFFTSYLKGYVLVKGRGRGDYTLNLFCFDISCYCLFAYTQEVLLR